MAIDYFLNMLILKRCNWWLTNYDGLKWPLLRMLLYLRKPCESSADHWKLIKLNFVQSLNTPNHNYDAIKHKHELIFSKMIQKDHRFIIKLIMHNILVGVLVSHLRNGAYINVFIVLSICLQKTSIIYPHYLFFSFVYIIFYIKLMTYINFTWFSFT